jgi:hypothetical protein
VKISTAEVVSGLARRNVIMMDDYPIKHRRGSSPQVTQNAQELYDSKRDPGLTQGDPSGSRVSKPATLTAVELPPSEHSDDSGRWQDDGGEGGEGA